MVACHTGIYAGLAGKGIAPNTLEAYDTGEFWPYIMHKWGEETPKKLLKRILYSGLNGASMTGKGAIREALMESCTHLPGHEQEAYIQRVLHHPILQELAFFQSSLIHRDKIYLPGNTITTIQKDRKQVSLGNFYSVAISP